jgi:hypothetical protein
MKGTRMKLEEILKRCELPACEWTNWEETELSYKAKVNFNKLYEELSTLIQKEREEAVENFIKWFNSIPNGQMIVFDETYREYLSQTKGGKR